MAFERFGRKVRITTADNGTTGTVFDEQFDIEFGVIRSRTSEPNQAEVRIYGLARSTRNQFREEFKRIRIEAGHVGNSDVIFSGDIKTVNHSRTPQGIMTTITAGDGELAWQKAKVNTTLAGATPKQVVKRLVALMPNVTLGRVYGLDGEPAMRRPYVMNGMVRDRLDELARTYGARWSIQNGVFEWVANIQAGTRTRIVALTPKTGLLDTPEPTEKGVKARCLLEPALKPNDVVEIRSGFIDTTAPARIVDDSTLGGGLFRINEVAFQGSTFSDAFYSIIDAQRMAEGVVEQEPTAKQAEAANNRA